ncbi:MAG TPA: hypothetical protein VJ201_05760 [Candidatus Babeliales bacterium]|nr:hypothetical protein [Candidatus Babeliales bacterium]
MKKLQPYDDNQLHITPEIIQLMQWLCEYETEALKNIITRALNQGLKKTKYHSHDEQISSIDEMQDGFITFMSLLEYLYEEVVNERAIKQAGEHHLLPALDKIDNKTCDASTIQSSLTVAASKIERNPHVNPKEILFKELLRRWVPTNKTQNN